MVSASRSSKSTFDTRTLAFHPDGPLSHTKADNLKVTSTANESSSSTVIRFCTACEHGLYLPSDIIEEEVSVHYVFHVIETERNGLDSQHASRYPSHRQYIFSVKEDNPLVLESIAHHSTFASARPDHISFMNTIMDAHVPQNEFPWKVSDTDLPSEPEDVKAKRSFRWRPNSNPFSLQYCLECRHVFETVDKLLEVCI